MKKKNILFIDHHNGYSGGQKSLELLISKIENSFDVYIVLDKIKGEFYNRLKCKYNIQLYKINKVDSRSNNYTNIHKQINEVFNHAFLVKTIFNIAKYIKKNKIDILYTNSYKTALIGVFVKMFCNVSLVFRVRTSLEYTNHGWIDRIIFKYIDVAFANSYYVKNTIPKKYHKNVIPIYTPVDFKFLDNADDGIMGGEFIISVIGRISERKRQIEVLEYVKEYGMPLNTYINFYGDYEEKDRDYYLRFMSMRNTLPNKYYKKINYLGFKNNIKEVMLNSSLIWLPSVSEPLSRVVIESLALGRILMTTNDSGNKELVNHLHNGFLYNPLDLEQVHKNIEYIRSTNDIGTIKKNARETIINAFSYKNTIGKEIEILSNIT